MAAVLAAAATVLIAMLVDAAVVPAVRVPGVAEHVAPVSDDGKLHETVTSAGNFVPLGVVGTSIWSINGVPATIGKGFGVPAWAETAMPTMGNV